MNRCAWMVGASLITVAGCNVLLDFETAQCSVTRDCEGLGEDFQGTICVSGSCRLPSGSTSDGSSSAGASGAAGAAGASGCSSTAQCVTENEGEPSACVEPGQPCVPLQTEACPLVFGDYESNDAVYIGAFLDIPETAPLSQMSALNVQLAIDEFNGSVGGLPGGPLGKLRKLVTVVCRNESAVVADGARHLTEDVRVPAVLAHLPSGELKQFFVEHALPNDVFVMNPGFADNSLTALSSAGLFWHMIGDVRDVAASYPPLLARVEARLEGTIAPPLRVAMVVSRRFAEQSIADTLAPQLRFNGKSVIENRSDFFSIAVPALVDEPDADYTQVNQALLEFAPHVIIALTREEFVYKILPAVEGGWSLAAADQPRPFYILPTALSANLDLLGYVAQDSEGVTSEDKRQRIAGVAPASAEDLTLYHQFLVRFRTAYPQFDNPGGFENFYDAVYLLANAMFAAGSVPRLSGPDVARGMQRATSGNTIIDVGPTHIADGFAALAAGGNIRLNGTMGLADFDPGIGARRSSGSVYCIQRDSAGLTFAYDVLRYDANTSTLVGDFNCFEGL